MFKTIRTVANVAGKTVDVANTGIRDAISAGHGLAEDSKKEKKIDEIENQIIELKVQIGDYYYRKYAEATVIDETPMYFCKKIDEILIELRRAQSI